MCVCVCVYKICLYTIRRGRKQLDPVQFFVMCQPVYANVRPTFDSWRKRKGKKKWGKFYFYLNMYTRTRIRLFLVDNKRGHHTHTHTHDGHDEANSDGKRLHTPTTADASLFVRKNTNEIFFSILEFFF